MEAPNEYIDQIDDFLTGRLGEAERTDFEHQLQSDVALQQAVKTQELLLSGIDDFGNEQLKARLQRISADRKQRTAPQPRLFIRRMIAAAAVFLLLLAVGWWWQSSSLTPDQHYANHFEPYSLTFNSRTNDADLSLAQFEQLYRGKKYSQLTEEAGTYLSQNPKNYPLQLAVGISYMELEKYQEALPYFDTIINANDPFFSDQARWYKALAYLKTKQPEKSKALLEKLAKDPSSDRQEAAIQLLQNF